MTRQADGCARVGALLAVAAVAAGCAAHERMPPYVDQGHCDAVVQGEIDATGPTARAVFSLLTGRATAPKGADVFIRVSFRPPAPVQSTAPPGWELGEVECEEGMCGVSWRTRQGVAAASRSEPFVVIFGEGEVPRLDKWSVFFPQCAFGALLGGPGPAHP